MVANREKIECNGMCKSLTIFIQGLPMTTDFYVLPVAACQLVLGVQWLATVGPIEMDYTQLTMTLCEKGVTHIFHGLKNNGIKAFR